MSKRYKGFTLIELPVVRKRGFTLIELLVVIAIIGILASIVIVGVGGVRERARDTKRKADLKTIQTALENYYSKEKHYPITTLDGLALESGGYWDGRPAELAKNTVNADPGCTDITNREPNTSIANWIPELVEANILSSLPIERRPEPSGPGSTNPDKKVACYIYQSDGRNYILSAWDTVESDTSRSDGGDMYSRAGFRQADLFEQYYYCDYETIRGFYPYSYTLTNMKCP